MLGGTLLTVYTDRIEQIPAEASPPVDPRLDLFFRYEPDAIDYNDNLVPTLPLPGTSGSSVWEYLEPAGLWTAENALRVVGVQSAAFPRKYFRAKSWEHIWAAFRDLGVQWPKPAPD
jgi:hypothetical protein